MKIELGSGVFAYRNNKPAGVSKNVQVPEAVKTDIAEFSCNASPALDKSYAGVKASIMKGVTHAADPARIEALKQSVREGTYHVSTDDLVKAILKE